MQTVIADAVDGVVEHIGHDLLRGRAGPREQLVDGLLQQIDIVASAGLEDELTRGGALSELPVRSSPRAIWGAGVAPLTSSAPFSLAIGASPSSVIPPVRGLEVHLAGRERW